MSLLRSVARGLRTLFQKERVDRELDEEFRTYEEMATEEKMKHGMGRKEAARAVRLERGNLEVTKEIVRSGGWESVVDTLWRDVRFGARTLRKSPGFAAVSILTLALGIGATTTIFSMVNGVLLKPLVYRQPNQLYLVQEIIPELSQTYPTLPANLRNFRVWQQDCHSFEAVAIVEPSNMTLTGYGEAEQISGGHASASLFEVLGVRAQLGRTFLPQEDAPGKNQVVVLSDSFWRDRFHGDETILGRSITLDGKPFQVAGVLPASFRFPTSNQLGPMVGFAPRVDYFTPLGLDPEHFSPLGEFNFAAIARLSPGTSASQALAELNTIQARIAKDAKQGVGLRAELIPLERQVVGSVRDGLLLLLAGVGAVLLIVCVNLANLLLVRLPGRMREAAIRTAIGASRGQLTRQLLTENGLIAVFGGALGIGLAYFGVRWLVALAPASLPRLDEIHVDARVLLLMTGVSLLAGFLFGVLPAWRVAHADPQQALRQGGTTTEGGRTRRLRESLIGFEVGVGTLLLIVAGLLTTSLVRLLGVDKGFSAEHVLAMDISLPPQNYSKPEQKQGFYDEVLLRVRALPGVGSAGWISKLPLEGQEQVDSISVPGRASNLQAPVANYRYVSPGYFQAMGIPLRQGRWFEPVDGTRHVAVISESVAKEVWRGENPLGLKFKTGGDEAPLAEVIGVVGDIRTVALDESPLLVVYVPAGPVSRNWSGAQASLVMRTTMPPAALGSAVRDVIRSIDSGVPILHLRPMTEIVSESVSARRFEMVLVCLFALFALLLAALGIYGVVAYAVTLRRRELGIRMAFGARAADLRSLVVRQGMLLVLAGWAAGLLAALFIGRMIRGMLFGVAPQDPPTILTVTVAVLFVGAMACYIPAARTAKLDPMVALRHE
jgi:putative ABC transport system permease protein